MISVKTGADSGALTVNLQAGLFEFLQRNPLAGSDIVPAHSADMVRHSLV
ncbi:hypothetical protein [Aeromonas sp. 1HA1]|nr:hypothetical protein [Aeromonas sp. 1HA1]MDF2415594.1 hypothetical protein [Aeromonas sp. 1HA1]